MEQPTFRDLYTLRPFRAFFLFVFNLLCIFFIDFRTLIALPLLWLILALSIIIGYEYSRRRSGSEKSRALYHGISFGPAVVHTALIINLLITFNPRRETYRVYRGTEQVANWHGGGTHTMINTLIHLENGAYERYTGIRLFADESDIRGTVITYTFATGIFGITVAKDWEFSSVGSISPVGK